MPVPVVHFTKDMTPHERSQSLHNIWDWCQSAEASESKIKILVLKNVIEYAHKYLAVTNRLSFMFVDKVNDLDCQVCNAIFRHVDLPEVLFLQYVINQLSLIQTDLHPMKDGILPIVQQHKNTLMIPITDEIRSLGFSIAIFSLLMRFNVGLIISAVIVLCSEQLANWRITRSMENKIALKETGDKVSPVEDGYDNVFKNISKGYHAVTALFHVVISRGQAEKKEIPKPSLK